MNKNGENHNMKEKFNEVTTNIKKNFELVQKCDEILTDLSDRGFILTLRQLFYQLLSKGLIKNSHSEYTKLSRLIDESRRAGLIDWEMIEDRTRNLERKSHWDSPAEILEQAVRQYSINTRLTQPIYIEVFCEKQALSGILVPICKKLDVPFMAIRGNASTTVMYETAKRLEDKNAVILYLGDCDATGLNIPKNIERRLNEFGVYPLIKRIALNLEQVQRLNLPPAPLKEKDPNAKKYKEETGLSLTWELDALPPETLQSIIQNEVDALTDKSEFKKMKELESAHKKQLQKFIMEVA